MDGEKDFEKALSNAVAGCSKEIVSKGSFNFEEPHTLQQSYLLALERAVAAQGVDVGEMKNTLSSHPYIHLRNVYDTKELPLTPTNFNSIPDCEATRLARVAAILLGAFFNKEMVSYGSENQGQLFVNLTALSGEGYMPEKSISGMRGHTDAVSFPFPGTDDPNNSNIAPSPDIVCLLGLRNPNNVPTTVMRLDRVLPSLTPDDLHQLKLPNYLIGCQGTFQDGTLAILNEEHKVDGANILRFVENQGWEVRFSHGNVRPSIPDDDIGEDIEPAEMPAYKLADAAVTRLRDAVSKSAEYVVICPGDILWINNRITLHGRAPVGGTVGGTARWLLRTYAIKNGIVAPNKRYPNSQFKLFP